MLQNPRKTLGFKKNMVYKIPPGGEVNHIQPVAYQDLTMENLIRHHLISGRTVEFGPLTEVYMSVNER